MNQDPRQALNQAQNLVEGKGFFGFLTKLFLGKDASRMAAGIHQAQGIYDDAERQQRLREQGVRRQAKVLAIEDTGALVNFNPIVELTLEVQNGTAGFYVAQLRTAVSKIAIPRVGDQLDVFADPVRRENLSLAQA